MVKTKQFCLLLLFFTINVSYAWGQTSNINIVKNNVTIRVALDELEHQTGYSVGYDERILDANKKISVNIKNESIDDALSSILKGTKCTYSITNKHIIIVADKHLASEATSLKTVKGKIVDKNGEPIIGASIKIEGSPNGTITDVNGNFKLQIDNPKAILEVGYLGYEMKKITVGNKSNFAVVLNEYNKELNEIVVVGYNTVKKRDITTAVAIVSTKDISERPITSAGQAIQGKAAGVQVIQPSGKPGVGLSIRVRGATSVNADNEPLYVVDGVPMDNISNLSPNDIDNIQILKDASSAAIYGARAANGVVLISTKRGKQGKTLVRFNSYTGVSNLGKRLDALNTEQYRDLQNDLSKVSAGACIVPLSDTRYTNWTNAFFKTGVNQNYQVSVTSGTDKLQYFASAGYMKQTGIVQKSDFYRYSLRTNIDSKLTNWLKLSLNIAYTNSGGNDVYDNRSAMRAGSILSVINTPPFMQEWSPTNPGQYDEDAYGARIANPFAANAADQTNSVDRLVSSLNFTIDLAKNLKYKSNFAVDLTNSKKNYYLDPTSSQDGRGENGRVQEGYSRNMEWLWENTVSYNKSFKKHHLSFLGGTTIQDAKFTGAQLAGFDLLSSYPNLRTVSACNQLDKDNTWSTATEWALASFLGNLSYNYDDKYLLTSNMRADGSSRFAPGHRWGVFPSLSAAWRISSESLMANTRKVIDDLKIRVGWGLTGNQSGIGNYSYLAQYTASRVSPTTNNMLPGMALSPNTAANPDLTWERTTQTNIGLDFTMFKTRLTFTADAYYKKTTDLLLNLSFPSSANLPGGFTRNDGEMTNKGLEFSVSSHNLTGAFTWDTDANISMNRNKLTRLGLSKVYYYGQMYESNESAIILKEGLPLGTFFGFVSEGVDPETGNIKYKDLNKNNIVDPGDRTIIGCAQPKFIYGITNTFGYKGFSMSIFLQGSQGNQIFNASKIDMTGMIDFRNQSTDVLRRWERPGMITDVPRVGNVNNNHNSSRYVEDGSYLRVKDITLSYNLKSNLLKKLSLSKVQIYTTMQNILTFTKYSGYDPEVSASGFGNDAVAMGIDYGTYPQSKTVIFGLNVEF